MLYKNILVAFDGSDPSREALVVAKDMVGDDPEATLHVLSVLSLGSLGACGDSSRLPTPAMQQIFPDMSAYEAAVDDAKAVALGDINDAVEGLLGGVACTVRSEVSVATKPADGICEYAEDLGVDMIVMGRRGLSAVRAMLGSVSYSVLHQTDIPVVTVK